MHTLKEPERVQELEKIKQALFIALANTPSDREILGTKRL
jgi:hypothetical protein